MKLGFWKRDVQPSPAVPHDGFALGDVVYHKVSGAKVVITGWEWYDATTPAARVETGLHDEEEFTATLVSVTKTAPTEKETAARMAGLLGEVDKAMGMQGHVV